MDKDKLLKRGAVVVLATIALALIVTGIILYSNQPSDEEKEETVLDRVRVEMYTSIANSLQVSVSDIDSISCLSCQVDSVSETKSKDYNGRNLYLVIVDEVSYNVVFNVQAKESKDGTTLYSTDFLSIEKVTK